MKVQTRHRQSTSGRAAGRRPRAAKPAAGKARPAPGRKRWALSRLGALERVQGWHGINKDLGLKGMGITVASFPAGEGYEHPHFHAEQEEVYLLAHGRGQMVIDGEKLDLEAGDLVRVDAPAVRALRSHPSSPSVWVMVGATPGHYREKDYTELEDQPAGF